ncbi:acyl-CoA thioesterase [Halorarius halobius]|uniref:acyl-CoA thioesterase n=1 Tax=Halorarius halobius TaxID=2962671 RepID=UPI0020CD2A04|nr:thioesterase family protein [Halorarius halobius]
MPHRTDVPVRWGDTDAGGLIYFPRYFHLFVVGLNDYFAPVEDHLMASLRDRGHALPAVDASASFEAPLRAGDTASVETRVEETGESSLSVAFDVEKAADGEAAAGGEVTFVLVDEAFEPAPLPDEMRATVEARGD